MHASGFLGILLIVIIGVISYKGFNHQHFFDFYKFQVGEILLNKKYYRLITAGFLHVGWMHLVLNILSLLFFSNSLELMLGPLNLMLIYFASLLGGNLLALLIHRNDMDYSAVGASGAISGLIFASIAVAPNSQIGFFILPFSLPAWLFGLLYMIFSIYGIRSSRDNIGHDAHLGGGLVGLLVTSALYPGLFIDNIITTLLIAIPVLVFLYLIVKKPSVLLVDNLFEKKKENYYTVDHRYNQRKADKQKKIDQILDKIHHKGMKSLTKEERDFLENANKN